MKNRVTVAHVLPKAVIATFCAAAFLPACSVAQVPVDDNGAVVGSYEAVSVSSATGNEDIPLLSTVDLEELVGPIALYPDDLLAIVLPAAAYPLQIVDAARFLEALEDDPTLEPDPDWDESVVALLNYPEVIELLDDDIDWTWRLGEAVVAQQADVIAAVETFRDRAYAAGNLKSDTHQTVSRNEGIIEITPVALDEIYVPYYEPERVVVYQPRPVYYYYPRPYPVYYYPYSSRYSFDRRHFWGVTTAFTVGWYSDSLNVFHHSYFGHPYYGRAYWDRWWYRRPSINIHNTTYVGNNTRVTVNRYDAGDRWRPRTDRRDYARESRSTRNREYPRNLPQRYVQGPARDTDRQQVTRRPATTRQAERRTSDRREQVREQRVRVREREPIVFRERPRAVTPTRSATRTEPRVERDTSQRRNVIARQSRSDSSRQVRRAEPDVRAGRSTTTTPRVTTRRTPPAAVPQRNVARARTEPARARPDVQVRRPEPTRSAPRSEPQRYKKSEQKRSPSREVRQSRERSKEPRSRRRQ